MRAALLPGRSCGLGPQRSCPCPCSSSGRRLPLPAGRGTTGLSAKKASGGDTKKGEKKPPKRSALADLMKKKQLAEGGGGGEGEAAAGTGVVRATQAQYSSDRMFLFVMASSYFKLTKKYLIPGVDFAQLASALYNAPFVCLAHNKGKDGVGWDPVFTYANRAALELWETTWDELVGMPSRKSAAAEDDIQKERNNLLAAAATSGVVTNYEGWRVSARGNRFKIKGATLFNVSDLAGTKLGQAVVFNEYELADGTTVKVTAAPAAEAQAAAQEAAYIPTADDIAAAEARVKEQADHIRDLKGPGGLGNQDIAVQLAVSELKKRKAAVEALQKKAADALAASQAAFDDEDGEAG